MQTQAIQDKPYFTVTNNVSRVTFEYVRDNPGLRNGEICDALSARGYKRGSVSSLLGQMVLAGLLRRDTERKIWAVKAEYEPINLTSLLKRRKANKLRPPVAQTRAMKNYLPKQEAKEEPQVVTLQEVKICNSVEELLNTLTVAQARELFDRLKKMFA